MEDHIFFQLLFSTVIFFVGEALRVLSSKGGSLKKREKKEEEKKIGKETRVMEERERETKHSDATCSGNDPVMGATRDHNSDQRNHNSLGPCGKNEKALSPRIHLYPPLPAARNSGTVSRNFGSNFRSRSRGSN